MTRKLPTVQSKPFEKAPRDGSLSTSPSSTVSYDDAIEKSFPPYKTIQEYEWILHHNVQSSKKKRSIDFSVLSASINQDSVVLYHIQIIRDGKIQYIVKRRFNEIKRLYQVLLSSFCTPEQNHHKNHKGMNNPTHTPYQSSSTALLLPPMPDDGWISYLLRHNRNTVEKRKQWLSSLLETILEHPKAKRSMILHRFLAPDEESIFTCAPQRRKKTKQMKKQSKHRRSSYELH